MSDENSIFGELISFVGFEESFCVFGVGPCEIKYVFLQEPPGGS